MISKSGVNWTTAALNLSKAVRSPSIFALPAIGYQKESPSVRNSFLAAYELRSGLPKGAPPNSASPDTIRARLPRHPAGGTKVEVLKIVVNLLTPDNGEKYAVELSNATLTNIKGHTAARPDLTITVNRSDLENVMGGKHGCLLARLHDDSTPLPVGHYCRGRATI